MGVQLVTRKNGLKLWRIDFWAKQPDLERRRVYELLPEGASKTDAVKLLKQRRGEVAAGTYRDLKAEGATFADLCERFLADYPGRRGRTRSSYYSNTVRALAPDLGAVPVVSINLALLDRLSRKWSSAGLSQSTVHKRLTALGTILRQGYRWGMIERDLARDMTKPGERNTPYRPLTRDEWGHLQAASPEWLRPVLTVALLTATRRQELLYSGRPGTGLTWDQVKGDYLELHQGKTGSVKVVPLGDPAAAILAERKASTVVSRFVFSDESGRPITGDHAARTMAKALDAAGIESDGSGRVTFHSIRATAATVLGEIGHPEYLVAQLLGHSRQTNVTRRYIQTQAAALGPLVGDLVAWVDRTAEQSSGSSLDDGTGRLGG